MTKPVLLVAKTYLPYGGRQYGANMQFHADPKEADALVESGQAARVSDEKKAAAAEQAEAAENAAAAAPKK